MAKIGDLFVKLGLKWDEFKKGMAGAKDEIQGFGSKLSKMKAGAVAAWAVIGTAVITFTKDFISATNKMADKWEHTMGRLKASYHTFLAELSNTSIDTSGEGGKLGNFFKNEVAWWKRLFGNTKAAGDAAAEMTKAFDAEFELVNSVRLQKSAIQQELNELYTIMRDTTLTQGARQSAMERYKALLEPIAQAEIAVYGNMLDEAVKSWSAGQNLSRVYSTAEVVDFLSMYGTDAAGATAKYGELASVYENRKGDKQNKLLVDTAIKFQDAVNQMSNTERELARVALSIKKSGIDPIIDEVELLDEELIEVDLEIPPIDTTNLDKALDEIQQNAEKYREELAKIEQYNGMIEDAIISATQNSMQALTDMMFGVGEADMKQVLAAFLAPFGDTMKQMGSMIMAEGIAMDAFKKSFTNPVAAIAAGAALVAIGSAVSSGLQSLTANPTGGGTTAYAGSSTMNTPQNYESTLTVEVVGKISGNDINISGKKAAYAKNR